MQELSTALKKCKAAMVAVSLGAMVTAVGAQEQDSASELAQKSSNPLGGDFMMVIQQFDNYIMDGDLPGADKQSIHTYTTQPVFSLPLKNTFFGEGWTFVDRPTIPIVLNADLPSLPGAGCPINISPSCTGPAGPPPPAISYTSESGFADPSNFFMFGYSWPSSLEPGLDMVGLGLANTFPIGASSFSSERWSLGPSFLAAHLGQRFIFGALGQQFWDVGKTGSCNGCANVDQMLLQYFYYMNFDNGWQVGSAPLAVFNWETGDHSIPVGLGVYKTGRVFNLPIPFKLGFEVQYYVEKPDLYGQEWNFRVFI